MYKKVGLVVILGAALLKLISAIPQPAVYWNNKVYVALGFHGNLYHSFRGDTNDENGFGRDIRVIRHIIRTLDRFNSQGVPVRASWDFDNHFSLENLLPVHAPDILRDIRRRVDEGQDEVLLMSYNNGLASAMTRRELTDTVNWAVSNPWGSGVKDIFGTYTPVIRPQEMMTTPGDFGIYTDAGIRAVSLYYSATPFDTFRLFTRKLSREEAYNPLTYENHRTGEDMLVIPTYNVGDLVENTSLAHWVEQLHHLQRKGEIRRDVLIFINFDADSEYWTGAAQLKWPLNRLPNTKGLEGLIREVKDKNYVRFTTLKDYLADHGPAGTIRFRQDTADGSFDGYTSWSEKKGSTDSWTRIQRARRTSEWALKSVSLLGDSQLKARISPLLEEAYLVRLEAMSTTNFGMATPFLAPQREKTMGEMLGRLDRLGSQIRQSVAMSLAGREQRPVPLPWGWADMGPILLAYPGEGEKSRYLSLPLDRIGQTLAGDRATRFYLRSLKGAVFSLVPLPGGRATDPVRFHVSPPVPDGIFRLCAGPGPKDFAGGPSVLSDDTGARLEGVGISLSLDARGRLKHLAYRGRPVLGSESLTPWFKYEGRRYSPESFKMTSGRGAGGTAFIDLKGVWPGPEGRTLSRGSVRCRYALVPGLPYLFISGDIQYPTTASLDVMKADAGSLAREMDLGWEESAPAEISLLSLASRDAPVRIFKTNYLGVDSAYNLDYFRHSSENLNLDNANNHITPGMVGILAGDQGLALGFDQSVAANFAGVPVRTRFHPGQDSSQDSSPGRFSVSLNPFGTYHGRQNRRPTWGNGLGHEAALISGEQYHSAAPTFNGRCSRFALMLGVFDGPAMPEQMTEELRAYANPAVAVTPAGKTDTDSGTLPLSAPAAYTVSMDKGRVTLTWEPVKGEGIEYTVRMGKRSGSYPHVFRTGTPRLVIKGISPHQPFSSGQRYYAVIEASAGGHGIPSRTPEIRLDILDGSHISARTRIPWKFSLKVIWASLKSLLF